MSEEPGRILADRLRALTEEINEISEAAVSLGLRVHLDVAVEPTVRGDITRLQVTVLRPV